MQACGKFARKRANLHENAIPSNQTNGICMPEADSTPPFVPIQAEDWLSLLNLTDPERKDKEIAYAWGRVKQQTEAHVPKTGAVSLDGLFVELLRLQLLVYPVVVDWKKPLSKREWAQCEQQQQDVNDQVTQMRKLSLHVRKRDPELYPELATLFNAHQNFSEMLLTQWESFRADWREYKKDWEHLQEQSQRKRDDKSAAVDEAMLKTPQPPPLLNRDRWHALFSMVQMLTTELRHRCRDYLKTPPPQERLPPAVLRLIDDCRQVQMQTNGFELLDKVKWVQRRNAQLAEELQRLTGDEILTPDLMKLNPEEQERAKGPTASDAKVNPTDESDEYGRRRIRPLAWVCGGATALLVLLFVFSLLPKEQRPGNIEELPHLIFNPSGPTRQMQNEALSNPEPTNVQDLMVGLSFDLPARKVNPNLVVQAKSALESGSGALPAELSDLNGKPAVLQVADEMYLFWENQLTKFDNALELQRKLQQLEQQFQRMQQNLSNYGEVPYSGEVVPTQANGEALYGVQWQDGQGNVMGTLYENRDGTQLRLSNGEVTEGIFTPYELTRLLEAQESAGR